MQKNLSDFSDPFQYRLISLLCYKYFVQHCAFSIVLQVIVLGPKLAYFYFGQQKERAILLVIILHFD